MNEYISPSAASFTTAISIPGESRSNTASRPPRSSPLLGGVQNLFLAVAAFTAPHVYIAAFTAPHVYIAETPNLSQSVSSAVVWGIPRKGRKISLREARQIALRILAETERELQEERSAEAQFLLGAWEDRYIES